MKHPETNFKNVPKKKPRSMDPSSKSQKPPAQIQRLLDEFQLITVALAIAIDAVQ